MTVAYAFGLGLGLGLANFGSGRDRSPREIVAIVRRSLPVVAWYGATGNIALNDVTITQARQSLREITGVEWAVVSAEQLAHGLDVLAGLPEPAHDEDERPTPGLTFAVSPSVPGEVTSTRRAFLQRIADDMVVVWKLDLVRDGKLDRDRRRGGWGAVSQDVARQVGGRWTTRSRRPIDGLCARVSAQ